jgi:hypothetical protein
VVEIDRRTVVGMMEEPVSIDAADPSAWVRRDGRWLCALHTESITGAPSAEIERPRPRRAEVEGKGGLG